MIKGRSLKGCSELHAKIEKIYYIRPFIEMLEKIKTKASYTARTITCENLNRTLPLESFNHFPIPFDSK